MTYTGTISLDSEDTARVAFAAPRSPQDIPRYLRLGVLPEMLEAELATPSLAMVVPRSARDLHARLLAVIAKRFKQQGG
jgi:hypothetical protein